jgi:short-subunit dehydrogenase
VAHRRGEDRRAPAPRARGRRCRQATVRRAGRAGLQITPVAVVTGASSGIGEATARALAARGWRCILIARRADRLRTLAAEIDAEFEVWDVADRAAVDATAAALSARHPAIQLLVINAGIPGRAGFTRIEPERLEEVLRVNYLGAVWTLRAFLPALEAAGRADVVNVVSVAGAVAFAPSGPYSASKHAQLAFSRAAASELRGRGIHVHTVNPGFVETEGFPQASLLRHPVLRHLVVGPERVAQHIVRVVDHDKRETFVPGWYRAAAVAQALVPGAVARLAGRFRYRPS